MYTCADCGYPLTEIEVVGNANLEPQEKLCDICETLGRLDQLIKDELDAESV